MRIFLIGFMGSGKSHWGKIWADKYNLRFHDLDQIIEKREGKTIVDIFEHSGEDIFRLLETKMLRETTRLDDCIIACGGGTPCFHDNLEWMKEKGYIVYLSASPNFLFSKIVNETDQRPLIKVESEAELLFFTEQKLKERQPVYESADLILKAEDLTEESFEIVLNALKEKKHA